MVRMESVCPVDGQDSLLHLYIYTQEANLRQTVQIPGDKWLISRRILVFWQMIQIINLKFAEQITNKPQSTKNTFAPAFDDI